jgi:hypothetical protein
VIMKSKASRRMPEGSGGGSQATADLSRQLVAPKPSEGGSQATAGPRRKIFSFILRPLTENGVSLAAIYSRGRCFFSTIVYAKIKKVNFL